MIKKLESEEKMQADFEKEITKAAVENVIKDTEAVVKSEPKMDPTAIGEYSKEARQFRREAEKPSNVPSAGVKYDDIKVRYELLPPEMLHATSVVLTKGAAKYADRNWERGILYSRVFGALMRHMWAWWGGNLATNKNFFFGDLDPEWNYSHLWHASCCLSFLITYEARGMTKFDDRPVTHNG